MRPALTMKNAAKAVFVLPIRVPMMTAFAILAWIGESAVRAAELLNELLPGLDPDYEHQERERVASRKRAVDALMSIADKR